MFYTFYTVNGLAAKAGVQAREQDDDDCDWNAPGKPAPHPCGEFEASSGVRLGEETAPSPSLAPRAVEHERQRADGQRKVADEKVLQVEHG